MTGRPPKGLRRWRRPRPSSENSSRRCSSTGPRRPHLRWAVRAKPVREDYAGRDIDLGNILEAIEDTRLTQWKRAIEGKERPAFEAAFEETLTMCDTCRKALDRPYLRARVPTEPETRVIDFDPSSKWPL